MSTNPTPTRKERREAARQARVAAEQEAAAKAQRNRRLGMLGGIVLIAAVVVVAAVLIAGGGGSSAPKKQAGEVVPGQKLAADLVGGIPESGYTLGNPNAKVTVLELADLKCPICKEYTEQVLPRIVQDYVRTGKAKIEFHPFTVIDDQSNSAFRFAAGAAQQNKFWNFIDIVYFNQGNEQTQWATDDKLAELARGVRGLDVPKMRTYSQTDAASAPLATANTLASRYGATGTPTLIVGPSGKDQFKKVDGFDYGSVSKAIDAALKQS